MYNASYMRQCLVSCVISCIQEHWLYPDNMSFLDTLDPHFNSWVRCCSDINPDSTSRRGKGGIAFLWRKSIDNVVEIREDMGNDRIAVLSVKQAKSEQIFIVGVYLPTVSESTARYRECVDVLESILYQLHPSGMIIVLGDFNAHIGNVGGPRSFTQTNARGSIIGEVMDSFELLSVNSQSFCKGPVETFYANGGMAKITVDHILIPTDKVQFISYCAVLRECSSNLSYHRPIFCVLQATLQKQLFRSSGKKLLWKKLEDEQYQKKYQDELAMRLQNSQYKNLKIETLSKKLLEHFPYCSP